MSVYLHDIPLDEAQARIERALAEAGLDGVLGEETIPLDETAGGRTLAHPVWARISSPHYNAAAMDGFAVSARDTAGASPAAEVRLALGERCAYVDTGDPLPDWADAVVPIEETEPKYPDPAGPHDPRRPAAIAIRAALAPWKHVRAMGEDMVATELVLPQGHVLRPVDLGACAGSGQTSLTVARRPMVALLPTGSELKPVGAPVGVGDIIEYNSIVLASQVSGWGGAPRRYPVSPDELPVLKAAVAAAAREADLVLLLSGSSAGAEDFSAQVISALGELLFHGVAVRPGHPVIFGMVRAGDRNVPIVGVPGYPVSAALTGEIFIEPLLSRWLGRRPFEPQTLEVEMSRKITSPPGDDDYVRVVIGRVGDRTLAAPISRGAGVISSLVRADGIVVAPRGIQGLSAGERVPARLYRSPDEIARTILATGSHDVALDLAAQHLASSGRRLVSANVGSLGGLLALRRGEAHLAGSHLIDPESGEYNLPYVRRYLPETPVVILAFAGREQGLLVQPGNPKGFVGLEDLLRKDVVYVNRQRGAGTRVLLDHELAKTGLAPDMIAGYDQEEFTHLGVAAAVASGRADCGLGIPAAAQAVGLDFVPLFQERYDLIVPKAHYNSDLLAPLVALLQDPQFQTAVSGLPGYDVRRMGTVVAEAG
ncbi:MAG TPA: molybdopterin biosynthesis protein [Anaerolineales bacterium]|nr:molybdopterin biosynthesis protein [Anaerolineales bacterium]